MNYTGARFSDRVTDEISFLKALGEGIV